MWLQRRTEEEEEAEEEELEGEEVGEMARKELYN